MVRCYFWMWVGQKEHDASGTVIYARVNPRQGELGLVQQCGHRVSSMPHRWEHRPYVTRFQKSCHLPPQPSDGPLPPAWCWPGTFWTMYPPAKCSSHVSWNCGLVLETGRCGTQEPEEKASLLITFECQASLTIFWRTLEFLREGYHKCLWKMLLSFKMSSYFCNHNGKHWNNFASTSPESISGLAAAAKLTAVMPASSELSYFFHCHALWLHGS